MSIQSVVDFHLSDKGGRNRNITVKGEAGDVVLPKNVNLHLFDCQPGKITATLGNNAIFLARCVVQGIVDQHDGSFIAEDSKFIDEIFWRNSNRAQVKTSVFFFRITAITNSLVDLYDCDWDGKGSFGVFATDRCRVTVSNCTIRKREKGVWAQQGSFIEVIDTLLAVEIGVIAEDNAMVRMTNGENQASQISCKVLAKSQVYLSKLASPLIASDFHVIADDHSKLHSEGTDFNPTATISIQATNHCTIEVVNFDVLKSTGGNTIDVSDNCNVFLISGDVLESQGAKAIYATNNCRVRSVDVTTTRGIGNDAVHVDNRSKYVATVGTIITSTANAALRATNQSTVSVKKYGTIVGIAGEGCILDLSSRAWFATVDLVKSESKDAVKLSHDSDVSFQNCTAVLSTSGNGIVGDTDCTIQLQRLLTCVGKQGSGIKASNNTNVDIIYAQLIQGVTGFGIEGDNDCSIKISRSTLVKGLVGGISNKNIGSLKINLLTNIVTASGYGILCANQIDGQLALITSVQRGGSFVNSHIELKDCEGFEKIDSSDSTIDLHNVTLPGAINSAQDIYDIRHVTINGTLTAVGSGINVEVATLNGVLTLTDSTLDIEKTSAAAIVLTNATIKARLVSGTSLSLVGSAGDLMGGGFTSIVVDDTSAMTLLKCAGPITGTGNVIVLGGGTVAAGMNRIEMGGDRIALQNKLNARIEEAGADIFVDTSSSGGDVITVTA